MDRVARPCGVDNPDAEGSRHAHVGILQNAEGSVKPRGAVFARARRARDARHARHVGQLISSVHRVLSVSPPARFSLLSCAAVIVKRIVPIRLISLTCSPTWISTLYRPGFHAPFGGESVR